MALSTAQDLVDSALRLLGAVDQEGSPTTAQRNQGLDALNALIDSLVLNNLANYVHTDEAITLTTASTTWGSGATINTVRPVKVLAARRVSGSYEYPIDIIRMDQYRATPDKSVTGTISAIAYDPTYAATTAYGTLYALGGVGAIKVTSLKPWTQYASGSTSLLLPPGYTRLLRHALAVELSPEYTMPPPQTSSSIAESLMAHLRAVNATIPDTVHPLLARGGYDINTDGAA